MTNYTFVENRSSFLMVKFNLTFFKIFMANFMALFDILENQFSLKIENPPKNPEEKINTNFFNILQRILNKFLLNLTPNRGDFFFQIHRKNRTAFGKLVFFIPSNKRIYVSKKIETLIKFSDLQSPTVC